MRSAGQWPMPQDSRHAAERLAAKSSYEASSADRARCPRTGAALAQAASKEQEGTKTLNRKHPATAMPAQGQAVPGPLERQPPVKKRSHTQSIPKTKKSNADRFSLFYSGAWFPLPCWETIARLRLLLHDM
jgi:hypothetical protein